MSGHRSPSRSAELFRRRYGAGPLHLLALLASFALAGYAAQHLLAGRTEKVIIWFVGAAVLHDLLLLPLYALADVSVARLLPWAWGRRHCGDSDPDVGRRAASVPVVNHLRFPVAISLLLLLVYAPEILRKSRLFTRTTGLSASPYLGRWLLVTGLLFAVSAMAYAVRLRRSVTARRADAA